jgi:hypothetical protein
MWALCLPLTKNDNAQEKERLDIPWPLLTSFEVIFPFEGYSSLPSLCEDVSITTLTHFIWCIYHCMFLSYICNLYYLVSILCMLWKSWKHKVRAFSPSNQLGALFKLKSWAKKHGIVISKKWSLIETKKLWICHTYAMQ